MMRFFPLATGVLEFGAAVVYAYNRQWLLALTWFFYSLAATALGFVR